MRLPEQRLYDRCKTHLPPEIRLERIENIVAAGTPDIHAICRGLTTWMELKAIADIPVRPDTQLLDANHKPSIEQRNWHLDYARCGGRSLIVVGISSKIVIGIESKWIRELCDGMPFHKALQIAATVNWNELSAYLQGERK